MNLTQLRQEIVAKLFQRRIFGAKHIHIDAVVHTGFKSHIRGAVRDELKQLMKEGIIVYYDKGREALQLNIDNIEEIKKILEGETHE